MTTARAEQIVAAEPDVVWELWTDVEGSPQWDRDVAWSRLGGDFLPGTEGEFKLVGGPRVTFELTEVRPGRGYSNVAWMLPGLHIVFDHELTPLERHRSRVTHVAHLRGPVGRLGGRWLRGRIERALERALVALAGIAEARSAARRSRVEAEGGPCSRV